MSRSILFVASMITAVGLGSAAIAWGAQVTRPEVPASSQSSGQSPTADQAVPKPGDPSCLRDTGSLIPPKPGHCMPVIGRSYSGEAMRRTGYQNNARALQMLDPSIRIGH